MSMRDPNWPWRGLHEEEEHHPLMQGKTWREFWEARGWGAEQVQQWKDGLDKDVHRAITESGWWQNELMKRVFEAEQKQGGEPLNHDQVQQIAQELLNQVQQWAPKK
jgi:hypothetical protein